MRFLSTLILVLTLCACADPYPSRNAATGCVQGDDVCLDLWLKAKRAEWSRPSPEDERTPLSRLFGPSIAHADPPYTMSDPIRYARAGGPVFSPPTIIGTTTRWVRATGEGTASPPLCVAWDTMAVFTVSGEMTCAWTMTTTITLGAQDAHTASWLVDNNGPDGDGACDYFPGAGSFDSVPQLATLQSAIGARSGVCTGPISYGRNLAPVYPPCRVDGDCADAGGSGTCDTSPSDAQRLRSCAFYVCRASAADTQITAKVSR